MLSEIKKELSGHPWQERIIWLDTVDSTNNYAKQLALEGAAEGTVVIAGHQTGGRGRLGRSFSSPASMGIYMSVILRPGCRPEELMHLTCATGVAASRAVEKATGVRPGIKWTNDLVVGKRKLGGILTELAIDPASGKVDWAVVGIGINCCQQSWQFLEEIRDMACSLEMDWQDTPSLFAALIRHLADMRRNLLSGKAEMMGEFARRCVTIGSKVSILRGDEVRHAKAVGVDEDGGLQVVFSDGTAGKVTSGEVSIRGMYGYL